MFKQFNAKVLILSAIIISIGALFVYKQYQKSQHLSWDECIKLPGARRNMMYPSTCYAPDGRESVEPFSNIQKESPQDVSDWKTYENTTLGFSMRYPATYFQYQEESPTGIYLAPSKGVGGNGPKFLEKTDMWFEVGTETSIDYATDTPTTPIVIGGFTGKKHMSNFSAVAGNVQIYFYDAWVMVGNKQYAFSLSSWDPNTIKQSEPLFDQILETIQFTK